MGKNTVVQPKGLFGRMTKTIGIDIVECQKQTEICPNTVKRMQKHCDACSDSGLCGQILNARSNTLSEPPDFCPNRKIMLALRTMNEDSAKEDVSKRKLPIKD